MLNVPSELTDFWRRTSLVAAATFRSHCCIGLLNEGGATMWSCLTDRDVEAIPDELLLRLQAALLPGQVLILFGSYFAGWSLNNASMVCSCSTMDVGSRDVEAFIDCFMVGGADHPIHVVNNPQRSGDWFFHHADRSAAARAARLALARSV